MVSNIEAIQPFSLQQHISSDEEDVDLVVYKSSQDGPEQGMFGTFIVAPAPQIQ